MIAEIVVDIESKQVNRSFDYIVPSHLEGIVRIGSRVKVLFGNRVVVGFVMNLKTSTTYRKKMKEIGELIDIEPILNEELISLAKFIAEHNFSFYASALQTMIPAALKMKYQKIAVVTDDEHLDSDVRRLFSKKKEISLSGKTKEELILIYREVQKNHLKLDTKILPHRKEKYETWVYLADETKVPLGAKGKALIRYLSELGEPVELKMLLEDSGFSKSVIRNLIDQKICGTYRKEILYEEPLSPEPVKQVLLTEEQSRVLSGISWNESQTYLLHGITGSGKTELYIRWIQTALSMGKTALMLVPEIALTPQITQLFQSHFQNDVVVMHSRLSVFERYSAWKKVVDEQVRIVVGARSAVFAPLKNIGVVIIDEEHEKSYRQLNSPRYDAKEIAILRSRYHHCPLVLGSATPDVADYYQAQQGKYRLLTLSHRPNELPLPSCQVIDMTAELKKGNRSVFSEALKKEILSTYQKHEQTILFLNRRGYASFVMCRSCGEVVMCPHCNLALTYHAVSNRLKCHTCGYEQKNVETCPNCHSDKIRYVGSGTQKVMEELTRLLPEARILRVDLDTTKKKEDYESAFLTFRRHEADILVGTQMIAKGLDFGGVTLVGIVNADLALHYPNYDASMTAFNLLEQVSGRAGRGEIPGKVLIQTYQPNHYVIDTVKNHQYERFYQKEIEKRRVSNMPPFSEAIEVMISSEDASVAFEEAKKMVLHFQKTAKESEILGPAEALPFKVSDLFRFTIQLKIVGEDLLKEIQESYPMYQSIKNVDIKITRM